MAEIIAAVDETAANQLIDIGISSIGTQTVSGSDSFGPFLASYSASGTLVSGDIDLIPPDIIRVDDLRLNWSIDLSFGFDLSTILPDFCLPQVCINIPCVGRVCTPRICIDWPTITIPFSFSDFVEVTADFRLDFALTGGVWNVNAIIVAVPDFRTGIKTGVLLTALGLAAAAVLAPIPFIGPLLAVAVAAILATIGVAGVLGLLGPILTLFVAGMKIPIYSKPQLFEVLPAQSGIDPAVMITIDAVAARIENSGEDELVLTADISA
jgi:hypothetical protein